MPDNKTKPKRGESSGYSPIDFTVPLQLEECLYWVSQQPLEAPLRVKVLLGRDTTVKFTAVLTHAGSITAHCEGELRRWQGTMTRVVGQIEIQVSGFNNLMWIYSMLVAGIVLMLLFFLVFPTFSGDASVAGLSLCSCEGMMFFPVYVLMHWYRRRRNQRELLLQLEKVLLGKAK